MNHERQHLQYLNESGEYPLHERARLSSTSAGNSRYSNDAASLITKDTVSATETKKNSSACGTVCRRVPIFTPHQGSTRSGMVAKDLHFATCVAQPVFRSGVERLLRARSARLRASRDKISKPVVHATDGAFRASCGGCFRGAHSHSMMSDAPSSSTCLWVKCREPFLRKSTWQT